MSVDRDPADNSHGSLDDQISQLMQCKPLSEQEFELAPRRGEPDATRRTPDYFL